MDGHKTRLISLLLALLPGIVSVITKWRRITQGGLGLGNVTFEMEKGSFSLLYSRTHHEALRSAV
jgi:hypothetical protein